MSFEKMQVPVDIKAFSLKKTVKDYLNNGIRGRYPMISAENYIFEALFFITFCYCLKTWRKPVEWYYHWKDPLGDDVY